jgi:hypothetical protein
MDYVEQALSRQGSAHMWSRRSAINTLLHHECRSVPPGRTMAVLLHEAVGF